MFGKRGNSRSDFEINKRILPKSNLSQVTIFVIIALLIVAVVVLFFVFKSGVIKQEPAPVSGEPAYTSFLSCIEGQTAGGIKILESQGGYIETPDFEPGSRYMPFSNQLDFLGNPVPYWYYVSANNIQRNQVPSKSEMEDQIAKFVEGKARDCDFSSYTSQGYEITQGTPKASVSIKDHEVDVSLEMDLTVNKADSNSNFKNHEIVVKSNFGELYNSALAVYNKEQSDMFLENYGIDTLRLYAPVDGVEISCSPLTWNADNVFSDLQDAIETNTISINSNKDKYFQVNAANVPVDVNVKFLNSRSWPYSFEVNPSESALLMANPVGNQPAFGILGFCYVPYHFVYDVRYPVLAQVSKGDEIFQFPMAVVILGNKPRQPLRGENSLLGVPELCENSNTLTSVKVYDSNLRPVNADVSFECLGTKCNIGTTSNGVLEKDFPQCVNGIVRVRAEGYKDAGEIYSSVDEGEVNIILDRVYEKEVKLSVDGKLYSGNALIYFTSNNVTKTAVYPSQNKVELGEGQYEVQVYIFKNSSINIASSVTEQCVDVPRGGLLGAIGLTKKNCFSVEVPSQIISDALSGGGKEFYYVLESELSNSKSVDINAGSLKTPTTLEDLQNNYLMFETKGLDISFE
ncbi:MAG: hypothetical protein AABW63_04040 [Nanoarchaeota archaeon]